jgi:hypothetical protein
MIENKLALLAIPLLPLAGAILAGFLGPRLGLRARRVRVVVLRVSGCDGGQIV